jgi:hypothetical protein
MKYVLCDFLDIHELWWISTGPRYETSEIRISTPNRYSYRYLTAEKIPATNTTHLSFQVQACNDAHIALKPTGRVALEVVLGGWKNTKSCFRTEIQGSCRTEYSGRILDCGQFQTFWIDWTTRRIRIGKTDNGVNNLLLTYRLNEALYDVEIGITTGFGATGQWIFQGILSKFYTGLWYRSILDLHERYPTMLLCSGVGQSRTPWQNRGAIMYQKGM